MQHLKTVMREVSVLEDVTCDCCGKSLITKLCKNICGLRASFEGCYDSTVFPDNGHTYSVDVCEECANLWFKTFKHDPLSEEEES